MKFRIKLLLYVKAHKRLSLYRRSAERGSTLSLFEKCLLKVTLAAGYMEWMAARASEATLWSNPIWGGHLRLAGYGSASQSEN